MTTTDALRERSSELRSDLDERSERLRQELRQRADVARDQLVERYHDLEEELPIEEVARKAKVTAWQAAQAGLGSLLVLPAATVRGLGRLSRVADDLAERGAQVSERGRELVAAVPPSAAQRRRRRVRSAGIATLGFLGGFLAGWFVAQRRETVVTYEPTLPASWEPTPDPVAADAGEVVETVVEVDLTDPATDPATDPGRGA